MRNLRSRRRRGVVLLLFTMMFLFVIAPAVGLALDAGVLFVVKDKMQTAVDGAALSATRSLSRGTEFTAQQSSASATASKFYHMNMESGFMGITNAADPSVSFPTGNPFQMTVKVDAVLQAPTYFMRIVGVPGVTVRASATTVRRYVNIMMVIDRSGSLGASCEDLRAAATTFAQTFVNGRDKLGLITFGTSYRLDFPLADNFLTAAGGNDIVSLVGDLECVGATNAGAAYWQAYQQLVATNEPGALNAILFFTDGQPNTIHMPNLEIKGNSGCNDKGSGRNGVIAATTGTKPGGIFEAAQSHAPGLGVGTDSTVISNKGGCSFSSNYTNVDNDVAALTRTSASEVDVFGNSLTGWKSVTRDGSNRISLTNNNVTNAGINVLVNAAERGRNENTNLAVMTYAVGLGSAVDNDVLNRVANAPGSAFFDTNKPHGRYIYASDASQLQSAFAQLASEVLRFTH